jgi:hypothetical protein
MKGKIFTATPLLIIKIINLFITKDAKGHKEARKMRK